MSCVDESPPQQICTPTFVLTRFEHMHARMHACMHACMHLVETYQARLALLEERRAARKTAVDFDSTGRNADGADISDTDTDGTGTDIGATLASTLAAAAEPGTPALPPTPTPAATSESEAAMAEAGPK